MNENETPVTGQMVDNGAATVQPEDGTGASACSAIDADWCVELNADCPTCGEYVNLLDAPDFWDCRRLEIAEHDTSESNNLEVKCPECYHQFTVCCRW